MAERDTFHLQGQHDQGDHAGGGGGGSDAEKRWGSGRDRPEEGTEVRVADRMQGGGKRGVVVDSRSDSSAGFVVVKMQDGSKHSYHESDLRPVSDEELDEEESERDDMRRRRSTFARLDGAEIFATGVWNGKTFSEADLDGIVQSFDFFNLGGRIPLKLGHNTEQPLTDGQPALGWVDRVWRDGAKLMADFRDVPKIVYDAIKNGLYKFVSVELLRDVKADTRVVPLMLDAVALLGADLPAVGSLSDLQALTMAAKFEGRERLTFTQAFTTTGGRKAMADDDVKVREELQRLREANQRLQDEAAAIKSQAVAATENFSKLQADVRTKEVTAKRKTIKDLLETAVRDKRMLPSGRERFERQFRIDSDDEAVMRMPVSDVEQYIKENPNPYIKPAGGTFGGDPDNVPAGGLPDRELMSRARKVCREWNKNPDDWQALKAAAVQVMKADPLLAERYRALPDDHADGKYAA